MDGSWWIYRPGEAGAAIVYEGEYGSTDQELVREMWYVAADGTGWAYRLYRQEEDGRGVVTEDADDRWWQSIDLPEHVISECWRLQGLIYDRAKEESC